MNKIFADLKIGDTVTITVHGPNKKLEGKVIYIHPEKRYFRVEFETKGGKKLTVMPDLCVFGSDGKYTDELMDICEEDYV